MCRRITAVSVALVLAAAVLGLMATDAAATGYQYKWSNMGPGLPEPCNGIYAFDANHVWVVRSGGRIDFYNGRTWTNQPTPTANDLHAVWASSPEDAWAVGNNGTILHFVRGTWSAVHSPTTVHLYTIWGEGARLVWAAGDAGTIIFCDGWTWNIDHTLASGRTVKGISGIPEGSVWLATSSGDFFQRIGSRWTYAGTAGSSINSIFAFDRGHIWAVGDRGKILRYNGIGWIDEGGITTADLFGVYATSAENAFAVGRCGVIVHNDGHGWSEEESSTYSILRGVAAVDENSLWAAGDLGTAVLGVPYEKPVWYLAEGSNAWGCETLLTIENPNVSDVTCKITYMTATSGTRSVVGRFYARSVTYVNTSETVPGEDFSTKVVCEQGKTIAVERTVSWPGPDRLIHDSHSSIGATAPSRTWYLPEGCSDYGYECWLLVQNPNKWEAECQVTYMVEGEGPVRFRKVVPAESRRTFSMAADIGARSASIRVISSAPVIAERSMYNRGRRGGHNSIGATVASSNYYLAEGSTAWGFTTYVLVQNPNPVPAVVNVTYMTPDRSIHREPFTMSPDSRRTLRLNDEVPGTDVSTEVRGSQPIIAERAMYWEGGRGQAMHASIGLTAAHRNFYIPDGRASWRTHFGDNTYLCVQNPNAIEITVQILYLMEGGRGTYIIDDTIRPNSRKTYPLREKINCRASIIVRSGHDAWRIMVERATYTAAPALPHVGGTCTTGGYSDR